MMSEVKYKVGDLVKVAGIVSTIDSITGNRSYMIKYLEGDSEGRISARDVSEIIPWSNDRTIQLICEIVLENRRDIIGHRVKDH